MTEISQEDAREAIRLLHSWRRGQGYAYNAQDLEPLLERNPEQPTLKSCPFCEGVNITVWEDDSDALIVRHWLAACGVNRGGCGASTGAMPNKSAAVRAWNRRA